MDNVEVTILPAEQFINQAKMVEITTELTEWIKEWGQNQFEVNGTNRQGDFWMIRGRVFVPPHLWLMVYHAYHGSPLGGHLGHWKTYLLITKSFWSGMSKDIKGYVQECVICAQYKGGNQKPAGIPRLLPVSIGPWKDLSTDLIMDLPNSSGYTAILSIVDHLSKEVVFIPTVKELDSEGLAKLLLSHV